MSAGPHAVISGGGTGGHVFEALAIARALEARGHDASSIELVGSRRGQEASLLATAGYPVTLLPGRGIVRRTGARSTAANLAAAAALAWSACRALAALARRRPRVVVSVGGYASFPADAAALLLGVPLVLVTIDAVPGAVHRLFARWAAAHAVAFPGSSLPRAVVTGVAVRTEILGAGRGADDAARARKELDLPVSRATVGVVGGSLGARRVNLAVEDLARRWSSRADRAIYHVTGRRDFDEMHRRRAEGEGRAGAAARGARGPAGDAARDAAGEAARAPEGIVYRMVPFEDRMARLYEAVDVMVCRAGASTVAELTVIGVPSVLVPLPGAPGDHQTANARALLDAGAAVLVPDGECDGERLAAVLDELLAEPERLAQMGDAARALGRPDAADRIAEVVDAHAR